MIVDNVTSEADCILILSSGILLLQVPEIAIVSQELSNKYGKEFAQACLQNALEEIQVNEKLIHTMSIAAPPASLVGE